MAASGLNPLIHYLRFGAPENRVIDPARNFDQIADVAIAAGRIVAIGQAPADFAPNRSIDAKGCVVAPGLVVTNAHVIDEAERIDAAFFQRRVQAAVAMRARLGIQSNGVRLVHGEADGLPGLIVDRYEDILSVQFLSAGTERWKTQIADALLAETAALGCTRLYERSDSGVRQMEGLEPAKGWLRGPSPGDC